MSDQAADQGIGVAGVTAEESRREVRRISDLEEKLAWAVASRLEIRERLAMACRGLLDGIDRCRDAEDDSALEAPIAMAEAALAGVDAGEGAVPVQPAPIAATIVEAGDLEGANRAILVQFDSEDDVHRAMKGDPIVARWAWERTRGTEG